MPLASKGTSAAENRLQVRLQCLVHSSSQCAFRAPCPCHPLFGGTKLKLESKDSQSLKFARTLPKSLLSTLSAQLSATLVLRKRSCQKAGLKKPCLYEVFVIPIPSRCLTCDLQWRSTTHGSIIIGIPIPRPFRAGERDKNCDHHLSRRAWPSFVLASSRGNWGRIMLPVSFPASSRRS